MAAFFPASSNDAALSWLDRPDSWPEGRLLLWGGPGVGKSHLLRRWAPDHAAAALDGAGLRWPTPPAGSWAIDDAELAPEPDLLHLLNDAAAGGRRVLLAARSPPAAWALRLPDLASRLRASTAVRIEAPEDALLAAILSRLCADRQLVLPEPARDALLAGLPRTPHALAEAAARLDRAALASGGRVTRALAVAVMDEMAELWHAEAS